MSTASINTERTQSTCTLLPNNLTEPGASLHHVHVPTDQRVPIKRPFYQVCVCSFLLRRHLTTLSKYSEYGSETSEVFTDITSDDKKIKSPFFTVQFNGRVKDDS